jgi:hypothetical protein
MKIIITENQYELLKEMEDKPKVYNFPSLDVFGNEDPMDNWNLMQKFLTKKGNPDFTITGDLDLSDTLIESLGNLTSVGGYLILFNTPIKSLGKLTSVGGGLYLDYSTIESLGNLTSVGNTLLLSQTPIESLGNLKWVGGNLVLRDTPISKTYTKEEIKSQVEVDGDIYL